MPGSALLNGAALKTTKNGDFISIKDLKGRWAVKVSGNWRLTFEFKDRNAFNVNIEDYH